MSLSQAITPLCLTIAVVSLAAIIGVAVVLSKKKKKHPVMLQDPNVKHPVRLVDKEIISHDTCRFRFALTTPNHVLGLPIGQHVYIIPQINNSPVVRPYTPVSSDDDVGYVDFVIKVYRRNVHPKFPDGGKVSQYLDGMEIGDYVDLRGPSGLCLYKGGGEFHIKASKTAPAVVKKVKRVGMIAGGTGITPMLQIIRAAMKDPDDNTRFSLLFANQSTKDILLKDELDDLKDKNSSYFKVWYTIDKAPTDGSSWNFSTGFVDANMIQQHLPAPSAETLILMCGPPPMIQNACVPALQSLKFTEDNYFAF